MHKLLYILFFILLNSNLASASIWDDIGQCFTDPCNCGHGDRYEYWNGVNSDKGKENSNCPPWNKNDGRQSDNCLLQFAYPGPFSPYYLQYCAEATDNSSYFTPKIKVRYQTCNGLFCWSGSDDLDWDGECVVWPTAYGLPMLRICARIALPANAKTVTPADPGYTQGVHLSSDGATVNDEVLIGSDGLPFVMVNPKLCAYKDPSLYDTVGTPNIDLLDYNPIKQPYQAGSGLSPIMAALKLFIQQSGSQNLGSMIGMLFDSINNSVGGDFDFATKILKDSLNVLSIIASLLQNVIIDVINTYGQLNRIVDSYSFGCVEIPLGPFPPPYCPTLNLTPVPSTNAVCLKNGLSPNNDDQCVNSSNYTNSFISNTIRISFDNIIPLCSDCSSAPTSDTCVCIDNAGALTASSLHAISAGTDIIGLCSVNNSNICIQSTIGSSTGNFRLVYGTQLGSSLTPSTYFKSDLSDCQGVNTNNCQVVWGVNVGNFVDANITFPEVENASDTSPLVGSFILNDASNDSAGTNRSFTASIVKVEPTSSTSGFKQEPNQICVYEGTNLVSCENRVTPPPPIIYNCPTDPSSSTMQLPPCDNNFFSPALVVSYSDGTLYTSAAVAIPSYQNPQTSPSSSNTSNNTNPLLGSAALSYNLAGYSFYAFATDDAYTVKPFPITNNHVLNSNTIYGNYKNNAAPYDTSGNATGATYLNGLEYFSDIYIEGGTQVCLQPVDIVHCSPTASNLTTQSTGLDSTTVGALNSSSTSTANYSNCVLAKLNNSDVINCTDFIAKLQSPTYQGMGACQPSYTNCSPIDKIAGNNGGAGLTINQCDSLYCYDSNGYDNPCAVSNELADRMDPASSVGLTLSSNQYYSGGASYDTNTSGLRDKTSVELGLCNAIPQPTCPKIDYGEDASGASWPLTTIGVLATGTCPQGYQAQGDLTRYCLANYLDQTVAFEPVKNGASCVAVPVASAASSN